MKKIYCFYLYDLKENLDPSVYPAIDGLDIITGNTYNHTLYAWTPNKINRKLFKQQRDMDKFKENIYEIPEEEFDNFSDQYSETFLEERCITTKNIDEYGKYGKRVVRILTTAKELETMLDMETQFIRKKIQPIIDTNILISEKLFINKYKKALNIMKLDTIISIIFPLDESDIPPLDVFAYDGLAIFTTMYQNTYRKDIKNI